MVESCWPDSVLPSCERALPTSRCCKNFLLLSTGKIGKKKWINLIQEHKNLFRKKKILASNGRTRFKNEIISVG
jgi:hypothetical protein